MQIYLVGGAVRDALMGQPVQDRDWVVVGSTPQAMLDQGYLPVGRDFPVFLHRVTKDEYALARTERKTAPGYRGFVVHAAPDVTLEQDLARRDITINSMAALLDDQGDATGDSSNSPLLRILPGQLIDPFGGQADLHSKVLRHTTEAFREDPVRILRVARFAARFPDFVVADETLQLMREMVAHGEVDALVPERVWQEISKGLQAQKPSRMIAVLRACGALSHVLPQAKSGTTPDFEVLDAAAHANAGLPVRFACLYFQLEPDAALLQRVPHECAELAELLAKEQTVLAHGQMLDAAGLVELLVRCDAMRRPGRFKDLLQASGLIAPGAQWLAKVLSAAQSVDTTSIAAAAKVVHASGPAVGDLIRQARIDAVSRYLSVQTGVRDCPN
jgi:tRNA nucleotidyltransferase (CCA-adding enzyme)